MNVSHPCSSLSLGARIGCASINSCLLLVAVASLAGAQEGRYYQEQGITYQDVPVVVKHPVREVRVESRPYTTYREQWRTDVQQVPQPYYEPVSSWVWVPRVHGWARPFQEPTVTWEVEPRYDWRLKSAQIPVARTYREYIPQTQMVQVPIAQLRFEERTEMRRVAVREAPANLAASPPSPGAAPGPAPPNAISLPAGSPWTAAPTFVPANPANGSEFGGVAALSQDPPRVGMAMEGNWRSIR